jgi:hypothetical protein
MGSRVALEEDTSNPQYPAIDRKPYLTFRPPIPENLPVVMKEEPVRSLTRLVGGLLLVAAATVAMVHGIYYTIDDHPVATPWVNQVTMVLATLAFIGAAMTIRGRHYYVALAGCLFLTLVMVWDLSMTYLCWCPHFPVAGYILIPLIGLSARFIFQTRSEFRD